MADCIPSVIVTKIIKSFYIAKYRKGLMFEKVNKDIVHVKSTECWLT